MHSRINQLRDGETPFWWSFFCTGATDLRFSCGVASVSFIAELFAKSTFFFELNFLSEFSMLSSPKKYVGVSLRQK